MSALDELLERVKALPEDVRKQVVADAKAATAENRFVPNPGPQLDAWFCEADELFFGGAAGCGAPGAGSCRGSGETDMRQAANDQTGWRR